MRRPPLRYLAVLIIVIAVVVIVVVGPPSGNEPEPIRVAGTVLRIGTPERTPAIPSGFVGLSLEQNTLPYYVGTDPQALDPVFLQLVRNLNPGQRPVLRFGGVSTDKSWYPVPGLAQPPWVKFTFTANWLASAHALATALDAEMIIGVNLEANSARITAAEATALLAGVGRRSIAALELGNEPELYAGFNWYRDAAGVGIKGRTSSWDPAAYASQVAAFAPSLPHVPLAGPAVGSTKWIDALGQILDGQHDLSLVTVHAYPLKRCSASTHVTVAQLLARPSSLGLAAGVVPAVRAAARSGAPVRVGEMNSVSCGGEPGVSNAFATSLWSLDTLFALAKVGVAGVNLHSSPKVTNRLFTFADAGGHWTGTVYPVYYGALMFARAAPPGSRLLHVSGAPGGPIRTWALRTPQGALHVVLINQSATSAETLTVHAPRADAAATMELLTAPSLTAQHGETLAGQSFGASTTTGLPTGTVAAARIPARGHNYTVTVPAHSAALLSVA